MATVIINGNEVQIGDHERLNGIQAARRAGVEIPHYCWHAGLSVVASCRMCLVETGTKDPKTGNIAMLPKLSPACQTPAKDGSVFVTNTEKVQKARAQVEEGLLLRHPVDCPICDKAGECSLQDYHFEYGQSERRADIKPFTSRRREMGDTVTLFVDRCVMCSRCVRFTREIAGTAELMVINRGSHEEIDVFPSFPLANKLSGNVVDLCPVGALGDKDFLYQQRVWFMKRHAGVCTGCSTGCSIWVEENQDTVYRLKPRENQQINKWWICDEGRYGYHHVHSPERLVAPERREGEGFVDADWHQLLHMLPGRLAAARPLAALFSPHLTVEEAWLLAKFIRGIDPDALLAVGPAPIVGQDEKFPGGFTIRAEKCPNRRGVEEVVRHFTGQRTSFEEFLPQLAASGIRGLWVSGGYKAEWIDAATAARFENLDLLVVQDLFPSPLSERATFRLPGGSFAEREGSYVNHADIIQTVAWAVRPPAGVRVEGSLYWELLGLPGLYNAKKILAELAAEAIYFAVAGGGVPDGSVPDGSVPDGGVDLKVNQLAATT